MPEAAYAIDALNDRINARGISIAELSRRANLNGELVRRSLAGDRKLLATELISLCKVLELDIKDFI